MANTGTIAPRTDALIIGTTIKVALIVKRDFESSIVRDSTSERLHGSDGNSQAVIIVQGKRNHRAERDKNGITIDHRIGIIGIPINQRKDKETSKKARDVQDPFDRDIGNPKSMEPTGSERELRNSVVM